MVEHRNTSIGQWLDRLFRFKTGNRLGNEVGEVLVPVVIVEPTENIVRQASANNTTAGTIFTTPTTRDFYITSATISFIKDATNTSLTTSITVVIDGATQNLLILPQFATTAGQGSVSCSYLKGIKIDRGTTININNSVGDANISSRGMITGYTIETTVSSTQ